MHEAAEEVVEFSIDAGAASVEVTNPGLKGPRTQLALRHDS